MRTTALAPWILALVLVAGTASAQQVELALDMPTDVLWPGSPFWVDLHMVNPGPQINSARLFVAIQMGPNDYWFYSSWCHYPPDLDWIGTNIAEGSTAWPILPQFTWPDGLGTGSAQFLSVVLDEDVLLSNLATAAFSWTGGPPPSPTPTSVPPTATSTPAFTPTPTPPSSTQTPTPTSVPPTATSTPAFTPTPTPEGFVLIPAGTFQMGTETEMCRYINEDPIHQVTLTRSFYMQRAEVTQAQWVAIFGMNPSYFTGDLNRPVERVTWFDCAIYCNRLSVAQGLRRAYYSDAGFTTPFDGTPPVEYGTVYWDQTAPGYRLPTESEWEYACRAGTTTAYNNGQDNTNCYEDPVLDPLAWYYYNSSSTTHPVGRKQANAWMLHDMHGNVWEQCWDWYQSTYPTSPVVDPTGPAVGSTRVYRGGSWDCMAMYCRSAGRGGGGPGGRDFTLGFRPVRTGP